MANALRAIAYQKVVWYTGATPIGPRGLIGGAPTAARRHAGKSGGERVTAFVVALGQSGNASPKQYGAHDRTPIASVKTYTRVSVIRCSHWRGYCFTSIWYERHSH